MTALPSDIVKNAFAVFKTAGDAIMDIRKTYDGSGDVMKDEDGYVSPQTIADRASDAAMYAGLSAYMPDIPVVTEENVYEEMKKHGTGNLAQGRYWIVDPMDGTAHFRQGRDSFAILGALIEDGAPIFGMMYRPAQKTPDGYFAMKGAGAFSFTASPEAATRIRVSKPDMQAPLRVGYEGQFFDPLRVLDTLGRENIANGQELEELQRTQLYELGAKTTGLVAEGQMDAFINLMDKCAAGEWDVAAPTIIMQEAGGFYTDLYGAPLKLGNPSVKVEPCMAYGDKAVFEMFTQKLFARFDYKDRLFVPKVA